MTTSILLLEIQAVFFFLYFVNVKQRQPEAETPDAQHEDELPPCTPPSNRTWMESKQELVSDEHAVMFWRGGPACFSARFCWWSVMTAAFLAPKCYIVLCCFWQIVSLWVGREWENKRAAKWWRSISKKGEKSFLLSAVKIIRKTRQNVTQVP